MPFHTIGIMIQKCHRMAVKIGTLGQRLVDLEHIHNNNDDNNRSVNLDQAKQGELNDKACLK